MGEPMIEAVGITKSFGSVTALDGVSLSVPRGAIQGLLGHNGAGKTTLVNILTTLVEPTTGTGAICGYDVVRNPREVRARIGLTGQFAAVDEELSGRENLLLIARLLGATKRQAKDRADELLEMFDLTEASVRAAKQYSGGMRRRLDLAASLVGQPSVLFLDEPTTGLDPTGRKAVWDIVERLARGGTTVLLTTQYLDEADRLADSIAVLSQGRVVASGTAADLKSAVGQRTVTVVPADATAVAAAVAALSGTGLHPTYVEDRAAVVVPVDSSADLAVVVRALDEARIAVAELGFAEPTLDDVYLALTEQAQPGSAQTGQAQTPVTTGVPS